jgi:hypothetical protein
MSFATGGPYTTNTFINSNPDAPARPRMRLARFGVFLSVAFAAVGLWLVQRG